MSELTVSKNVVVGLAFTLYVDGAIEWYTPASKPLEYLHGRDNMIPGLERQIEGMKVGEKKKNITVDPEEAYGEYDSKLIETFDRSEFPENLLFQGCPIAWLDEDGKEKRGTVQSWDDNIVTVYKINHPMAGKTLVFDVEIVSLREGTDEEIANGYVKSDDDCGCGCGCDDCGSDCGGCGGHCH